MLKHLKIALALILLWAVSLSAQSSYDFNRADITSLNNISKWKDIGAMDVAGMSLGVSSNQGYPYGGGVVGAYGGVYWDSALTAPYQVQIVLKQLSGTNNVKNLYIVLATSNTFATAAGYHITVQQMTGSDYMYLREFNQFTPIENGSSGYYPDGISAPLSSDHAVQDTFRLVVYADGRKTAIRKRGATVDSLSTTDATYTVTSGAYVYLYGREETTKFLIDDFSISAISAGGGGGTEVNPPVAGTLARSSASVVKGSNAYVSLPWTDDSAGAQVVFDADTGGGYYTLSTHTISGASGTQQSNSFTMYNAGTATLRGRVKDAANKWDTSATTTITFDASADSSTYNKKVYGYLTFNDTKWLPTSPGSVPVDSLPWDVLTHVSLFAAPGGNPIPNSYLNQLSPMTARAHASGIYAGLCYGGWNDAALINVINNSSLWPAWIDYNLTLIDDYGLDFIDFDIEGSVTVAAVNSFFQVLYDSLQTRQSANNPSVAPFIVLTAGPARAGSWASSVPELIDVVEIVSMMTYDYSGDWYCRTFHDNAPTSRRNYDGTGAIIDWYSCGNNSETRSMQWGVDQARAGGWPASKLLIGVDANPVYWFGGTFPGGRGPTYIRQPTAGNTSTTEGNLDFSSQWSFLSTVIDSFQFDDTAHSYWAHTGSSLADDKLWTMITLPGMDSGIIATRNVADSMNIGGVMFWNLGSEIWNTPTVPPGGRGWFFSQIENVFATAPEDTVVGALNPPTTFTPATGATGVSITATFDWNDVSGVNATAGYNFQIDNTDDFASVIKDTSVTPSQVSLTSSALSNNTTYYARVRVKNASNVWGGWSATISFTTIPAVPGAPSLTSPADAVTGQPQTITLFWSAPSTGGAATHYQLLVDDDVSFSSPFVDDSTLTGLSRQVAGLLNSTLYHWKVRAKSYAGGWGAYTTARTFTTGAAIPLVPTLLSPVNGASNQDTLLTLTWTRPAGADSFQIQVDSTNDFATPLKDTVTALASYTYDFTSGRTYYWRVLSNGTAGNSPYTSPFLFTIGTDAQPPAPGTTGYYVLSFNPATGKWEGKLLQIIESQDLDIEDYPQPLDTNGITWGPKGYKYYGGTTVEYSTSASSAMSAAAIEDSLQTLTLDSLTFDFASVSNLYKTSGGSYAVSGDNQHVDFQSVSVSQAISKSDGGTGSNLEGKGGTGQALFLEGPNDTVTVRQITTSDVSGDLAWTDTTSTIATAYDLTLKLNSAAIDTSTVLFWSDTTSRIATNFDLTTKADTSNVVYMYDTVSTLATQYDLTLVDGGSGGLSPTTYVEEQEDWIHNSGTGKLGWTVGSAGTGATAPTPLTAANIPVADSARWGILQLDPGTAATGYSSIYLNGISSTRFGGGEVIFEASVKTASVVGAGNDYTLRIGFVDVVTNSAVTDGAYFEWAADSGSQGWRGATANNSTRSYTTASSAVTADTWYRLRIVVNADASSAAFYINGVQLGSALTANIPKASGRETGIAISALNYGTPVGEPLPKIDYVYFKKTFSSAR